MLLPRPTLQPALLRTAMAGFFLLGGLMALLGALLPIWIFYLHLDLATAGSYFFVFNLGTFTASMVSRALLVRLGLRRLLAAACALVAASLLSATLLFFPIALIVPLILLGFGAGLLTTGVSWLMAETMSSERAATSLSLAGLFFGLGAAGLSLLVWSAVHSLAPRGLLLAIAVFPIALAIQWARQRPLAGPLFQTVPSRLNWQAAGSPIGWLLSLALFFQSGAEWAAGGWLALYWIRKLGVSLDTALLGLSTYWIVLTLARLLSPRLAWRARPIRLLAASTAAALFGCLFLVSAAGPGGALVGVLLLAAGLGALYPVTLGAIGERFPHYHPGFFNGVLSLSLIGGMLAPWLVGHLAHAWVIQWAVWVPALGVVMVFLLQLAIRLEARLTAGFPAPPPPAGPFPPQRRDPAPQSR